EVVLGLLGGLGSVADVLRRLALVVGRLERGRLGVVALLARGVELLGVGVGLRLRVGLRAVLGGLLVVLVGEVVELLDVRGVAREPRERGRRFRAQVQVGVVVERDRA